MMWSHQSWPTSRLDMRRWCRSAKLRSCCPSCCRPAERKTRGTVRSRTRRVGAKVVRQNATEMATATPQGGAVVVRLDGGHVRSRHCQEERHFEVIAGKVIDVGWGHLNLR